MAPGAEKPMILATRQFAETAPPGLSSHGQTELGVAIFFLVFCTLVVMARFWSRHLKKVAYGWDDWFILAALPVYYCEMGLQLYAIFAGGLGWHAYQATAQQTEDLYLQLTVVQFPYAVLFLLVRLSICCLFLRIFPQQWLQRSVYALICIAVLWTIFVIVTALTVCIPFEYNWNTMISGHCNNVAKKASYLGNAIWTIVVDAIIWVLPQFSVWNLQMPLAQKATISGVFALGIFDIVVSIVRCYEVQQVNFEDFTYAVYGAQTWTVVEISVALIIACAPMCKPAVEKLLPRKLLAGFQSNNATKESHSSSVMKPGQRSNYSELYEPHSWSHSNTRPETTITSNRGDSPSAEDLEMNQITVQRETIVTTDHEQRKFEKY